MAFVVIYDVNVLSTTHSVLTFEIFFLKHRSTPQRVRLCCLRSKRICD